MNNIHVDERWLFTNGPIHEQQVKPHELSYEIILSLVNNLKTSKNGFYINTSLVYVIHGISLSSNSNASIRLANCHS